MAGRRTVTGSYTFRLDLTDPANKKIYETFAACPWGTLNQTIVEAVRIGVEAMGCKPSPNAARVAIRKKPAKQRRVQEAPAVLTPEEAPRSGAIDGVSNTAASVAPPADTHTQESEGEVVRREPGPTQEQADSGAKQSQHRKVVGADPTRARAKVFDMVNKLTAKP